MKKAVLVFVSVFSLMGTFSETFAAEASGGGSMIPGPLLKVWGEAYEMHASGSKIKYQGSNPADGIKRISKKEVEFSSVDMPLGLDELKSKELAQFPFALGGIAPIVNLPNVYPGQFKLDGQTLGDILLGVIDSWNHPAIVALNPGIRLPEEKIIVVHRASPPGISTIIGDYLSKTHNTWKSIKGDGMAGDFPPGSIEVKNPEENISKIKNTPFSFGYSAVPQIMKNGLSYTQLKNKAGKFVSPSDENISAAAENANWDANNGFAVVLTDQPGANSWPLSMASYALMSKNPEDAERSREALRYFKYSLRYGGLKAIQYDYIPLPESVKTKVRSSWNVIVDSKGGPVLKD